MNIVSIEVLLKSKLEYSIVEIVTLLLICPEGQGKAFVIWPTCVWFALLLLLLRIAPFARRTNERTNLKEVEDPPSSVRLSVRLSCRPSNRPSRDPAEIASASHSLLLLLSHRRRRRRAAALNCTKQARASEEKDRARASGQKRSVVKCFCTSNQTPLLLYVR